MNNPENKEVNKSDLSGIQREPSTDPALRQWRRNLMNGSSVMRVPNTSITPEMYERKPRHFRGRGAR